MRVMLKLMHDGEPKYVGKIIDIPTNHNRQIRYNVFLHEDNLGNQHHEKFDSPGGIDAAVIGYLIESKIDVVHHYIVPASALFVTDTLTVLARGLEETSGGRHRLFLPYAHWTRVEGGRWYKPPWVKAERVLNPADYALEVS